MEEHRAARALEDLYARFNDQAFKLRELDDYKIEGLEVWAPIAGGNMHSKRTRLGRWLRRLQNRAFTLDPNRAIVLRVVEYARGSRAATYQLAMQEE